MGPKFPRSLPPPSCASPRPRRHLASILGGRDGGRNANKGGSFGGSSILKIMAPSPRRFSLPRVCLVCLSVFCVPALLRAFACAGVCMCLCACVLCARACPSACAPLFLCVFVRVACVPRLLLCLFVRACLSHDSAFPKRAHVQNCCFRYVQQPRRSAIV